MFSVLYVERSLDVEQETRIGVINMLEWLWRIFYRKDYPKCTRLVCGNHRNGMCQKKGVYAYVDCMEQLSRHDNPFG
jgi:hypothetical protein